MSLLDFLFPKKCLECGRNGKYMCARCLEKVPKVKPSCPVCVRSSVDGFTHVGCLTPYSLDGVVYLSSYKGIIRRAIVTMKYKFAYDIANELSAMAILETHKILTFSKNAIIVPIPIHNKRKKWRGFNQMEIIGEKVAKHKKWIFRNDLLLRKQYRSPQTTLKRDDRMKNTIGTFSFNERYKKVDRNIPIVIFDDVWTTGATLREAGKVLKRNGFKNVWGLTIAR